MNKAKHFLQDAADDKGGGGGGGVTAADARTYLGGFGHGEEALKGMADPDVLKLHGSVTTHVGKLSEDAVKAASAKAGWPSDWRQRLATDNADALKTLERFAEPAAMWKSYEAMRQKMASGELKAHVPFPEKGTPEEQGAWRKEQGIPEKPEAYDLTLPDGIVLGEADKPLVGEFLKFAHGKHMPSDRVKETLAWFYGPYREQTEAARAEVEREMMQKAEDQLRNDWGADYRPNMASIAGLLDANVSAESGMKERIMASIKREPEFAKLWAGLARQLNPAGTLVPVGGDVQKTILDEYNGIQKTRREDRNTYNKDEKMQARERELITAMQRMGIMDDKGNIVPKK